MTLRASTEQRDSAPSACGLCWTAIVGSRRKTPLPWHSIAVHRRKELPDDPSGRLYKNSVRPEACRSQDNRKMPTCLSPSLPSSRASLALLTSRRRYLDSLQRRLTGRTTYSTVPTQILRREQRHVPTACYAVQDIPGEGIRRGRQSSIPREYPLGPASPPFSRLWNPRFHFLELLHRISVRDPYRN